MKIVTLTLNPALDKSTETAKLIPEQKLRCSAMRIDAGGGGINVSKGIKTLGGASTAVYPAGGYNGLMIGQILEQAGIETAVLEVKGDTRENLSVTESSTNQQYRFTLPGVELSEADADRCLEVIEQIQPAYLVASGSLPPGLPAVYYEKVAAFAKKINARFILDTSGEPLQAAADEGLFLLKPNLNELSALVGVDKLETNDVDDAALSIIHQGKCEMVIVSLGAQGAMLVTKNEVKHIPAPLVKKQSTVGAGDSMVAGMVWALSQQKAPKEIVEWGVACGSAATMNKGTELFHLDDVIKLLKWIQLYGERYRLDNF
ncbi:MAG: 1-phosphofructokinase family hexose kinase [Saprospiraceae bacterium]|nr:1-phosphofructokinase family hexose kinase [Saprospiraceae bacterium]